MFRDPSSSCMMLAFGFACSIVSRIDFQIDHADAERGIAAHVRTIDEVLQVHVHGDDAKSFTTFAASAPPFCNWPTSGANLKTRVSTLSMTAYTSSRVSMGVFVCW